MACSRSLRASRRAVLATSRVSSTRPAERPMTAAGKDRNIKRRGELANVVNGEDRGRGPPDVAMGSAAAGERVGIPSED